MKGKGDIPALLVLLSILVGWNIFLSLHDGGGVPALRRDALEAATRMERAIETIGGIVKLRGLPLDPALDPNRTGLVGLAFSPITTTLGSLPAKRTGAQPDAAALLVRLLREAGTKAGSRVAIESSGSFPGFAIAAIVAAETLGAEARCLISIGSSTYGANRTELSLADMIVALAAAGIVGRPPIAVSPGGAEDLGKDIAGPELEEALARAHNAGATVVREGDFERDVTAKKNILDSRGRSDVFVSIGGNWTAAGQGSGLEGRNGLIRPGDFGAAKIPGRGLIQSYLREGIPVVRILDIEDLCARTGLAFDPIPWPPAGSSSLYAAKRRSPLLVLGGAALAIAAALAVRLSRPRVAPARALAYHWLMRRILSYFLVAVAVMALAVAIGMFVDAARGVDASDSIGGGCLMIGMAALSGFGAYRGFRPRVERRPVLSRQEQERAALEAAAAAGGKLTEAELSLKSSLSLDEAKRVLEDLASRGVAEIEVSSGGSLVYAFSGLIDSAEKNAAKPVDEA